LWKQKTNILFKYFYYFQPTSFSDDEDDPEVIEESVEPQAGGSKRKLDDHFPTKTTKRIRVATKQISIEEALKNVNSISIGNVNFCI